MGPPRRARAAWRGVPLPAPLQVGPRAAALPLRPSSCILRPSLLGYRIFAPRPPLSRYFLRALALEESHGIKLLFDSELSDNNYYSPCSLVFNPIFIISTLFLSLYIIAEAIKTADFNSKQTLNYNFLTGGSLN